MSNFHKPVLLKEVIDYLRVKKNSSYIDATLGGAGHTREIIALGGKVLGIDRDEEALTRIKGENLENLVLSQGNFKEIDQIAHSNGFSKVDGIIFDLGVSSHQIDTPERGFSFLKDGPLDMRMDKSSNVQAKDLLKVLTKGELYEIFNILGQERRARAISERIVESRGVKDIETTQDLVDVIKDAYKIEKEEITDFTKNDIAKRTFQALRIVVNDELGSLRDALPKGVALLNPKGRLIVITFHSLEDKIVKETFKDLENKNMGIIITKKPLVPTLSEMSENSRSKSAKLRVFEKN